MDKISGIYKITNKITNKFYIGSAFNIHKRWVRHDNDFKNGVNSRHMQNAWNKYGADAFEKEVVEIVDRTDVNDFNAHLKAREQHYIDLLNPQYNLSRIAMGSNAPHTEEAKRKISEARTGIKLSDETKAKLSKINTGRKHTEATRRKISNNAKINPNYGTKGYTFSEESRAKMSQAKIGHTPWNKGIPCSDDTKRKLSEAKTGIKLSESTKEKMSDKGNRILFNGRIFRSMRAACRETGLHHSKVREYCTDAENSTWNYV